MTMTEQSYEVSEAVLQAAKSGRKIEAIKLLRAETGLGLKEAKHFVEALNRGEDPGAVIAPPVIAPPAMQEEGGASGFIKMVAAIIVLVIAYSIFFAD